MNIRRFLLWFIPFLIFSWLLLFIFIPQILQTQINDIQTKSQKEWSIFLQDRSSRKQIVVDYQTGERKNEFETDAGMKLGDIAIDGLDRVWIAGQALDGLHMFDGMNLTSYNGNYMDLATEPEGMKIFAVNTQGEKGVDVFDGQQWKNYRGPISNGNRQEIRQVEVDHNGRIWILTHDFGAMRILELSISSDENLSKLSSPILTLKDGEVKSIDADTQGNIWVTIWKDDNENSNDTWSSGLYKFNGENWQLIPNQGMNLNRVVKTVFDENNHAWVMTSCGGVMVYDGEDWEVIIIEVTTPICDNNFDASNGIGLENQNRLWTWQKDQVSIFNDAVWTTLTPENSGIPDLDIYEGGVFAVTIDSLDRVWIATSSGISVSPINATKPASSDAFNRTKSLLTSYQKMQDNGMIWFIPAILTITWITVFFNLPIGVIIALIIGMLTTMLTGSVFVRAGYNSQMISPGILMMIGGVIGGYVGGQIGNEGNAQRSSIIFMILGLFAGLGLGLFLLFLALP